MSIKSRVLGLFNRQTTPEFDNGRPLVWLPAKRANIVVTHEKALELSTCFACVRVISEDIAKLPWNVFQKTQERRIKMEGSPLSRLLNTRPNPEMTAFTFREVMISWALTWGNGYAEIQRDIAGRPVALWPISPDRVEPKRSREDGRVIYEVNNQYGPQTILEQRDMFHLHGMGWDGLCGYSMVGLAAQSLGFGLAVEEHGASFYGNNTTIGVSLSTEGVLNDSGFERLQKQLEERKGSKYAYEGMIFEQGLKPVSPTMSQVDAQFTETRKQVVDDICRWWRVPPTKVGELSEAHFANVENLEIQYTKDTIMPWAKRLEEEADWKLIGPRSQASYTRIAIQGLMRGDSKARAEYYKEMFNIGAFSPNKILELEDMDPIGPEGDENYIQLNMTTLKRLNAQPIEEIPQETADDAVASVVARLASAEVRKAESAKARFDKDGFVGWMNRQNEKARNRQEKAFSDVYSILSSAYGEFDIHSAVDAYVSAERMELLNYFDGVTPNYDRITSAILEAIE